MQSDAISPPSGPSYFSYLSVLLATWCNPRSYLARPVTTLSPHARSTYWHMCLQVSVRKKILALTCKHKCCLCHVLILTWLHSWRFVLLVQLVAAPSPQGRSTYWNWQKAPLSKFFCPQLWTPLCSCHQHGHRLLVWLSRDWAPNIAVQFWSAYGVMYALLDMSRASLSNCSQSHDDMERKSGNQGVILLNKRLNLPFTGTSSLLLIL